MKLRHITKHYHIVEVEESNSNEIASWYNACAEHWDGVAHHNSEGVIVSWWDKQGKLHSVVAKRGDALIICTWTGEPDRASGTIELVQKGYIEE